MKKLNEIQQALKAPKGQKNTFGNYNYRSCEDILEAVKPLLGECVLTISDDIVMLGDRFYVKATATLMDVGFTDAKKPYAEQISVSAFARESLDKKGMDSAQITGAASSYARKYALNGLFCIDDTKDADTKDNSKEEPVIQVAPKPAPKPVDPFKAAQKAITETSTPEEMSKLAEKINASVKFTAEQKAELMDSLSARAELV